MKKILFPIVILVIIIVAGIAIYSSTKGEEKNSEQQTTAEPEQVENNQVENSTEESAKTEGAIAILFYGYTCGYCKDVNDWLEKNNVKDKVKFDHLEVYKDKNNNNLLTEKAKSCGLDENRIGVPFLYDIENNKCMSGSDKIIEFFESKI